MLLVHYSYNNLLGKNYYRIKYVINEVNLLTFWNHRLQNKITIS